MKYGKGMAMSWLGGLLDTALQEEAKRCEAKSG